MSKAMNLVGQRYGRGVVIARAEGPGRHPYWLCQCDCGNKWTTMGMTLRAGKSKSCGCLRKEALANGGWGKTHGLSKSKTWKTWVAMNARCSGNHAMKRYYSDRGIKVCERWMDFENFREDMGERPEGLTLDRIDPNKDYGPDNCRWASRREQRVNRRDTKFYTYNGKTMCLSDWIREITGDPKFVLKFSAESVHKRT